MKVSITKLSPKPVCSVDDFTGTFTTF